MARAPKANNIEFHADAWNAVLTDVVNAWAVPRAEEIADAANAHVLRVAEQVMAQQDPTPGGNTKADANAAEVGAKRNRRNRKAMHVEPPEGKRDYMVSVEGSDPLRLNDYRATVITVTERARIDNARYNTLIQNLHKAGGA
jgi:hypothetical protein